MRHSFVAPSRFTMDPRNERAGLPPARRLPRRQWLGSLFLGGAAVLGGAVALTRASGYATSPDVARSLRVLDPWQYLVVRDAARRIVAPDLDKGVPTSDEVGVAEFVDAYLVDMHPALRRDFLRLLGVVEQLAPLFVGHASRFTDLAEAAQDEVLGALEASSVDKLRAGFQALKSVVMLGYYRDPRTFPILGYAGPLVTAASGTLP